MPANPMSPYALQKLVGEQYLQMFTRLYGLDTVTTRYFNVFGPRQDPSSPYSGVIALFTHGCWRGCRAIITGDGEQTRDFTYIDNVVDGVLQAATTPDVAGRVINVATGRQISINQLAQAIQRLVGSTLAPQYTEPRAGDVRDSLADIGLARRCWGTSRWCRLKTASGGRSTGIGDRPLQPGLTADRRLRGIRNRRRHQTRSLRTLLAADVHASSALVPSTQHVPRTSASRPPPGIGVALWLASARRHPREPDLLSGRRSRIHRRAGPGCVPHPGRRHVKEACHGPQIRRLECRSHPRGRAAAPALAQQSPNSSPKPSSKAEAKADAVVNLNTATAADLESLPGIGKSTAQRIVEYRQKSGGFKKIEELMNVKGIGEKSFLKIKSRLTVAAPKA